MILQLDGVSKSYAKAGARLPVLGNVSLRLDAGDFTAVEGASGSGKSTLLLIAGGLLAPDQGRVLIGGQGLYDLAPDRRARFRAEHVGFVFQQFHLIPYLTVQENVMAPAMAFPGEGLTRRAAELIERFNLTGRAHHTPSELSIGERQRAALARALLLRPGLLLADEPTGNLDTGNAETVFQAFREFADGGGAVLLVTHDARATAHARSRLRLAGGQITPIV